MKARIYQPAKTAMSSGAGKNEWVLEFSRQSPYYKNALTGWNSSDDTQSQVRLKFTMQEEALAYAAAHGLEARLIEPPVKRWTKKSYADNFRWTD